MPDTTNETGHHGHSHTEAEADRANVGVIGLLFAITAILLAVASYMLWIYFERETEAVNQAQVLSLASEELAQLREQEAQWLGTAGVVSKEQGVYRVPIGTGMELFLREAQARRAAGEPQRIQAVAAPAAEEAAPEAEAP